jgi:hypothetical protein
MDIRKNVGKGEGPIRIIVGSVLIPFGFFLKGLWKPVFILVGLSLILTPFIGY